MAANVLKTGSIIAMALTIALLAFAFRSVSSPTPESHEGVDTHVYATWDRFEVDRCVAAWLIKRFVDSEAQFELHPVGSSIPSGGRISFDTPGARYERAPGKSVSAVVLEETGVDELAVDKLVQLVQATEVAFWMLEPGSEEANLRNSLQALWMGEGDPKTRFELVFARLDEVIRRE